MHAGTHRMGLAAVAALMGLSLPLAPFVDPFPEDSKTFFAPGHDPFQKTHKVRRKGNRGRTSKAVAARRKAREARKRQRQRLAR